NTVYVECRPDARALHAFPTRRPSDLDEQERLVGLTRLHGRVDREGHRLGLARNVAREHQGGAELPERPSEGQDEARQDTVPRQRDRKSTRLNSSHGSSSYAVFCLQKK